MTDAPERIWLGSVEWDGKDLPPERWADPHSGRRAQAYIREDADMIPRAEAERMAQEAVAAALMEAADDIEKQGGFIAAARIRALIAQEEEK